VVEKNADDRKKRGNYASKRERIYNGVPVRTAAKAEIVRKIP
jgi:hypothetical protein